MPEPNLLEQLRSHENPELIVRLAREINQLKAEGAKTDAISFINYCNKKGYDIPNTLSGIMDYFYLSASIAKKIRKV